MRIGLISDTHNNLQNVQRVTDRFREEGITTILHAGDVTRSNVLEALAGFEVWVAWGNMDRDESLKRAAEAILGMDHTGDLHTLTLGGKRIALIHGDQRQKLSILIQSGIYDYVIHGHTHRRRNEIIEDTHIINPGALGGSNWDPASFAILDLENGEVTYLEL